MTHPSTTGRLLLATPPLVDPHFDRSVVLVLDHDGEGALGLVLNRPTAATTAPGLAGWLEAATPPAVVYTGGPVEPDAYIGVARADTSGRDPAEGLWAPLHGNLVTVDLESDPRDVGLGLDDIRLFRGYAGWSAGQLDDELESGAWIVVDAVHDDVFTSRPDELWRDVLRRQGGRLAWLANCPDDITTN